MDAGHFDRIAMQVGRASGRRAVVRLLLGSVVGALAPGHDIARGRHSCAPPCGEDEECCSTGCEVLDNTSHCGACDAPCRDGEMCQQCKTYDPVASDPYAFCTAGPATERYRCCPPGQHNSHGFCCQEADPPAVNCCIVSAATECVPVCLPLTERPGREPVLVDNAHCGRCGNACIGGKVCVAGECACRDGRAPCDDGFCRECCEQGDCMQGQLCCSGFCCPQANAVCHTESGVCCVPDSLEQTCNGRCGEVVNNCGVPVNCGLCACDPPCPVCQVCDLTVRQCHPDLEQVGDACGDGQVCQRDGSCACDAVSCPACTTCANTGSCVPCPGCCTDGACVERCDACQICEGGQCVSCPNCCRDGACMAACGDCQTCKDGQCVSCASLGQRCCNNVCVAGNCCTTADCPSGSGQICPDSGGACQCPNGQHDCAGQCRGCCNDRDCRNDRVCSNGTCVCPTGPGWKTCPNGICAGPGRCCTSDDCGVGMECRRSGDICRCPFGKHDCGGYCAFCCHDDQCPPGKFCCISHCVNSPSDCV